MQRHHEARTENGRYKCQEHLERDAQTQPYAPYVPLTGLAAQMMETNRMFVL